jgi:hypothetical protein
VLDRWRGVGKASGRLEGKSVEAVEGSGTEVVGTSPSGRGRNVRSESGERGMALVRHKTMNQ